MSRVPLPGCPHDAVVSGASDPHMRGTHTSCSGERSSGGGSLLEEEPDMIRAKNGLETSDVDASTGHRIGLCLLRLQGVLFSHYTSTTFR